jgi:SpoVK/Ycf46/Vps4 family AAA+-type ATPase
VDHDVALTEVLDGVDAKVLDNFAFVVTTNYLDRIPDRLCNRPGRFDDIVAIPFPTEQSRRTIVNTISGGKIVDPDEIEFLVEHTANFPLAHMREIIIGKVLFGKTNSELLEMVAKFKRRLYGAPKKTWFQKLLLKFKKENDRGYDD